MLLVVVLKPPWSMVVESEPPTELTEAQIPSVMAEPLLRSTQRGAARHQSPRVDTKACSPPSVLMVAPPQASQLTSEGQPSERGMSMSWKCETRQLTHWPA